MTTEGLRQMWMININNLKLDHKKKYRLIDFMVWMLCCGTLINFGAGRKERWLIFFGVWIHCSDTDKLVNGWYDFPQPAWWNFPRSYVDQFRWRMNVLSFAALLIQGNTHRYRGLPYLLVIDIILLSTCRTSEFDALVWILLYLILLPPLFGH